MKELHNLGVLHPSVLHTTQRNKKQTFVTQKWSPNDFNFMPLFSTRQNVNWVYFM